MRRLNSAAGLTAILFVCATFGPIAEAAPQRTEEDVKKIVAEQKKQLDKDT